MSKQRAVRRVERERDSALRRAARAAEQEREQRRSARRRALSSRLRRSGSGRPTGILADRRRARMRMLLAALALVQVAVWVLRPDWASRVAALVVSLLLFPLLVVFIV